MQWGKEGWEGGGGVEVHRGSAGSHYLSQELCTQLQRNMMGLTRGLLGLCECEVRVCMNNELRNRRVCTA